MRIKTSELKGAALDYAMALAEGLEIVNGVMLAGRWRHGFYVVRATDPNWLEPLSAHSPSTDAVRGVYLIEQYPMQLLPNDWLGDSPKWLAWIRDKDGEVLGLNGPTMLIAACRAIVAARVGEYVDVPDELCE